MADYWSRAQRLPLTMVRDMVFLEKMVQERYFILLFVTSEDELRLHPVHAPAINS